MADNCKFQCSLKNSKDGLVLLNCYADTAEEFAKQIDVLKQVKEELFPKTIEAPVVLAPSYAVGATSVSGEFSPNCGLCKSADINSKSGFKNGRQWNGRFCNACGAADFGRGWSKKS